MINIGIIGAGFIAKIHAKAIKGISDARIIGFADIENEKAAVLAEETKSKAYLSIEELINDKEINTIAVCVPSFCHADIVKKIAAAKKNIFCEKPIALSLEDADAMIKAVKKYRVKAMVGHVVRFWPEYTKIKKMVETEYVGKPLQVFCQRLLRIPSRSKDYLSEERCGGAAIDLQIHDLDYLIYLFGQPKKILSSGIYDKSLGGWIHMNTNVLFDGVYGVIDDGWSLKGMFPFSMFIRVICTEGTIEWSFKAGANLSDKEKIMPLKVYKSDESIEEFRIYNKDAYKLQWEYFLNCIKNKRDVNNATFEDGREALKVALKTIESAENTTVVRY